jgi:cell wall-associated NlpC family hydrolase
MGYVEITANDAGVTVNDYYFNIYTHAYAADENGDPVEVFILHNGGFRLDVAGVYTVMYCAIHPVTQEEFYKACTITVGEARESTSTLKGTSDSRYRKYQQYRDEVAAELGRHLTRLNGEFADRMNLLRRAFLDADAYNLVRQYYAEQMETDENINEAGYVAAVDYLALATPALSNWSQILAVFVAKGSLEVEDPLDLFNLRKISFDGLDEVFWDMHELRFELQNGAVTMILEERSSDEMAQLYNFSPARKTQLDELLQPEFQRLFASLTGDESFIDMTAEQAAAIRAVLPADMTMHREQVVMTAHTMVDQVRYFWGGKYPKIGWNPLWGVPKVVTSQNSPTTGTVRPFGLDCSGFVTWVFINAVNDEAIISAIGNGSSNQWSNSRQLGWDEAKPGDLAFRAAPGATATNHVGIVVEVKEDGTIMVAHCSSSNNNVVITEAWSSSFRYIRRPILYDE